MASFQVPENIHFPAEEDKIGDYWKEIDAFQVTISLKTRPDTRHKMRLARVWEKALQTNGHTLL